MHGDGACPWQHRLLQSNVKTIPVLSCSAGFNLSAAPLPGLVALGAEGGVGIPGDVGNRVWTGIEAGAGAGAGASIELAPEVHYKGESLAGQLKQLPAS